MTEQISRDVVLLPPPPPPALCPVEGCARVQLIQQRQDDFEKEHEEEKKRNTTLFDRLFQRFDHFQWWLIGLMGGIILTLITAIIGLAVMLSKKGTP